MIDHPLIKQGQIIWPKFVVRSFNILPKMAERLADWNWRWVSLLRYDANKPILGKRT